MRIEYLIGLQHRKICENLTISSSPYDVVILEFLMLKEKNTAKHYSETIAVAFISNIYLFSLYI